MSCSKPKWVNKQEITHISSTYNWKETQPDFVISLSEGGFKVHVVTKRAIKWKLRDIRLNGFHFPLDVGQYTQ